MLHASDPLRSLGFSTVPDGYSFMVASLDPEAAVAEAKAAALREYGRDLGALIYLGREANSTEVVATLRSYGARDRRPFRASRFNVKGDGLDPNGITDAVRMTALARKGLS